MSFDSSKIQIFIHGNRLWYDWGGFKGKYDQLEKKMFGQ